MSLRENENDYDLCDCPGCDEVATFGSMGWNYCSIYCSSKHHDLLCIEAENERIAEITSGGQV
jgi:hypothetical protein